MQQCGTNSSTGKKISANCVIQKKQITVLNMLEHGRWREPALMPNVTRQKASWREPALMPNLTRHMARNATGAQGQELQNLKRLKAKADAPISSVRAGWLNQQQQESLGLSSRRSRRHGINSSSAHESHYLECHAARLLLSKCGGWVNKAKSSNGVDGVRMHVPGYLLPVPHATRVVQVKASWLEILHTRLRT
jgi:hypothetical protein